MSERAKMWWGIGVAVAIGAVLAASELVEAPAEWEVLPLEEVGVPASESGGSSDARPGLAAPATPPAGGATPEVEAALADARAISGAPAIDAPSRAVSAPADVPPPLAASTLRVAPDGRFVPNAAAAAFFASHYAANPSSSDELVRGHIVLALLDSLPARAADEAIAVLDRWRAARAAELALGPDADERARREARAKELGPELARALSR
ncbi:MAG: hypothetical protein R3E88_05120 [Myxococcota bacterium]